MGVKIFFVHGVFFYFTYRPIIQTSHIPNFEWNHPCDFHTNHKNVYITVLQKSVETLHVETSHLFVHNSKWINTKHKIVCIMVYDKKWAFFWYQNVHFYGVKCLTFSICSHTFNITCNPLDIKCLFPATFIENTMWHKHRHSAFNRHAACYCD